MQDLLTQGTTYTITEFVDGNVSSVAVRVADFCDNEIASVAIPTATNDNTLTFTLPESVTSTLPVGTASIRATFDLPNGKSVAIYRNVYVLPGDVSEAPVDPVNPVDPVDPPTPVDPVSFNIQYGFGASRDDLTNLTTLATTVRGTSFTTGVSERGQFLILVFPAGRQPSSVVNTSLGANVLSAFTLTDRTSGDFIYTLGALRAGSQFTYRVSY